MTKTKKRTITVHGINEKLFQNIRKEAKKNTPPGSLRLPMSTTVANLLELGLTAIKENNLPQKSKIDFSKEESTIDQWLYHYHAIHRLLSQDEKYSNFSVFNNLQAGVVSGINHLFVESLTTHNEKELLKLLPVLQERYTFWTEKRKTSMIQPRLHNSQTLQWLAGFWGYIEDFNLFPRLLIREYLPVNYQRTLYKKTKRWLRDRPESNEDFEACFDANNEMWVDAFLLNDSFNTWLKRFVLDHADMAKDFPISGTDNWKMTTPVVVWLDVFQKYETTDFQWTLTGVDLTLALGLLLIHRNLKPLVRIPRWIDEIDLLTEK
ncbi:MAG: hypothetical protein ACXABI_05145 [Candidatus Hodarchaeales archaeon]|jgi:hypothetical protein